MFFPLDQLTKGSSKRGDTISNRTGYLPYKQSGANLQFGEMIFGGLGKRYIISI
jgi:hypothetical protein